MMCRKSLMGLAKTAVYVIFDGAQGEPFWESPRQPIKDTVADHRRR